MFDIVAITLDDEAVALAVNTLMNKTSVTVNPKGGFRLVTHNSVQEHDGGGTEEDVLVIVSHGSPNSLSKYSTWAEYKKQVNSEVDWCSNKKSIYIVACSTAANGEKFLYGNFSNEIKKSFPSATVWASSTVVNSKDLSGTWQIV